MIVKLEKSLLTIELNERESDILARTEQHYTLKPIEEILEVFINGRERNLERLEVTHELRMRKANARRS